MLWLPFEQVSIVMQIWLAAVLVTKFDSAQVKPSVWWGGDEAEKWETSLGIEESLPGRASE